jgi:hypothetical protein
VLENKGHDTLAMMPVAFEMVSHVKVANHVDHLTFYLFICFLLLRYANSCFSQTSQLHHPQRWQLRL